jgi:DNA repair protein RadC
MENTNVKSLLEVAEILLTYKSNVKPSLRPKVELCEQFKVLLLNRSNKAIGIFEASSGSVTGTVADPKLIFASAIKANACSLIIAHNHPSGNLVASQADIALTRKIKEGGKLLEIPLLDHLIITTESYFSFADEGML